MIREEFERVTPESVGIHSEDIEWLVDQLEGDFTEPHGLMIMKHGKICAEGWRAPYAPGIRHGEQSHSKTYAATAVGIAYTEGILKLDERLIDIFPEEAPENPSENLQKLTIHDVLCMGCGMDEMPRPSVNWIRDFLHTPVTNVPGTTYMYNSVGSTILGAIVRKKTGLGLHEYLKPRLYDKIGIYADNHRWMTMPDGMEVGGGGLFATTEDNLRLMKLYADGGIWNGERILAEDYVKRATTLQNESATEAKGNPQAFDNFMGYGYQIWMCQPKDVYRADGAMGQFSIVVPDQDILIAITENAAGAHWAQTTLDTMWTFLERIKKNPAEKENPQASGKLAKRMKHLALPNPVFQPFSPWTEKLNGTAYQVEDGAFYLMDHGVEVIMGGSPLPPSIREFTMQFACDSMTLHMKDGTQTFDLTAGMDGSRRWNQLPGSVVGQVLANAYWEKENVLILELRKIETCGQEKLTFTFSDNQVSIDRENNMLFQSEADLVMAKRK